MPIPEVNLLSLCLTASDAISGGIIILDGQGRVVLWNQWLAERSGFSQAQMLGAELGVVFPELVNGRLLMAVESALKLGQASLLSQSLNRAPLPLFEKLAAQAQRIQQQIQVMPLNPPDMPRHCLIQINDVSLAVARETLLRRQAEELRNFSYLDGLTGVPNRRRLDEYLTSELRRAIRSSMPISVILIDIDFFKQYNDTYGHPMGDACLAQVAAALKACIQRPGDLLARYGGEEFAAVLVDTDLEGALAIAAKMRTQVQCLGIEHDQSVAAPSVTISLGVASVVPSKSCEVSALITAADMALYEAKRNGRNRALPFGAALHCALVPGQQESQIESRA